MGDNVEQKFERLKSGAHSTRAQKNNTGIVIAVIVAIALLGVGLLVFWANASTEPSGPTLAGAVVISDDGAEVVFKVHDGSCTTIRIGMPRGTERREVSCPTVAN